MIGATICITRVITSGVASFGFEWWKARQPLPVAPKPTSAEPARGRGPTRPAE